MAKVLLISSTVLGVKHAMPIKLTSAKSDPYQPESQPQHAISRSNKNRLKHAPGNDA